MDTELIRQVDTLQRSVDGMIRPEITSDFISPFLGLPGLIGFWPMATVQRSTGNVPNYAPTYTGATKQDFVYNGNPVFNYTTTGVPYIDLDGTGDYLSIADNTDIDIIGNEFWAAVPGLTMGCWAYPENPGTLQAVIGKTDDAQGPYWLRQTGADDGIFRIRDSTDTTNYDVSIIDGFLAAEWAFWACRFIPSAEIKIWRNIETNTNVTSIPAAILNGADAFAIGSTGSGGNSMTGLVALPFLCASALSDSLIQSLFQQTRSLFGV